jgi:tRNA pseudouridine55 synthase
MIDCKDKILLINKPKGITSFDCVKKIQNLARTKKVGHAGTLDPLASGLLIIATGSQTKQIKYYQEDEKEYIAIIRLGATTKSDDSEFTPQNIKDCKNISIEDIQKVIENNFIGSIFQKPPVFSALKIKGRRSYKLARMGQEVDISLLIRSVTIKTFDILEFKKYNCKQESGLVLNQILLTVKVTCTKGTYIRSLARDLGEALNIGGHIIYLKRTRIGTHTLNQALKLENL